MLSLREFRGRSGAPLAVHRTIEGALEVEMTMRSRSKLRLGYVVVLAGSFCAAIAAQAPQTPPAPPDKAKPAQQQTKPPAEANPFPEDTNDVPVIPKTTTAAPPDAVPGMGAEAPPVLPAGDGDPVRSPDDPVGDAPSGSSDFSSSSAAVPMDRIAPPPDQETPATARHKGRNQAAEEEHHETAKEDESVGAYYLDQKNWRAAFSRFQSALILDPENPDVYWGLAESERHLGQFAEARANYQKVMEYDPDSKHAKEAKKLLAEPEMAGK
jgi:type IV secretory pathway VirB10-like protein